MRLNNLPYYIKNAIVDLTEDQVFQNRFAEDKQLDYLESLKHDKQIEFYELQLLLNKKVNIFGITTNPITLALYGYLYTIKSSIIFDLQNVTMIDIDLFFYLLQTKDYNFNLKEVLLKSTDYCNKVLKLTETKAVELFSKIYKVEFRCLNLFPKTDEQKQPLFNVDWITSIISKVKPLTSYTTEQLYKDISISQIYYYFANYCRMQGDQRIFIRTEDEILFEEDFRMCQLIIDRLIEKQIISKSEREIILKQIAQEDK